MRRATAQMMTMMRVCRASYLCISYHCARYRIFCDAALCVSWSREEVTNDRILTLHQFQRSVSSSINQKQSSEISDVFNFIYIRYV